MMVVRSISAGLVLAAVFVGAAWAEPPVEQNKHDEAEVITIPLDQIWATRMPGTLDIEQLSPRDPLVFEIRRSIGFAAKDERASPAFAVIGTGLDALREAHEVFIRQKEPRQSVRVGSQTSVIFFAHETREYVHLHRVECRGYTLKAYYRFVPNENEEMSAYLAIIPLGKLPAGRYRVKIIRSPMEQKYVDIGFRPLSDEVARQIVCGSFSFWVNEHGD
jgi:hypothetical protein